MQDRATVLQEGLLNGAFMQAFNAEYRARRRAGKTRMTYRAAKQRYKRIMIARLSQGQPSADAIDVALSP